MKKVILLLASILMSSAAFAENIDVIHLTRQNSIVNNSVGSDTYYLSDCDNNEATVTVLQYRGSREGFTYEMNVKMGESRLISKGHDNSGFTVDRLETTARYDRACSVTITTVVKE